MALRANIIILDEEALVFFNDRSGCPIGRVSSRIG